MAKNIKGIIKLTILSGQANPAPPVGPALGQKKVNIMEFCKAFNAATQSMGNGIPTPTEITVYEDNSFTFITKTPPASYYLKKYASLSKGAKATKKEAHVGKVTMDQCREIAKIKMADLNTTNVEAGARIIRGSADSMGIIVEGE